MNEQLESLKQYVAENRARSVADSVIKQELLLKEWKEADIALVLAVKREVPPSSWIEKARVTHAIVASGASMFLIGVVLIFFGYKNEYIAESFLVADNSCGGKSSLPVLSELAGTHANRVRPERPGCLLRFSLP